MIERFRIEAGAAEMADLRARLRATRWPADPPDGLRELVAYWAEEFAMPPDELPRFRHRGTAFLHAHNDGFPLLLCHGWPDSSWRYEKVLPLLAGAGFDVVAPDMPGFGHSDGPAVDAITVAGRWAELMTTLGHRRFGVAGGDLGSAVSRYLALDHPGRVVAVHRMEASLPVDTGADYSPEERDYLRTAAEWKNTEGAYADLHRTRPRTAAVGLTDSPAGLAAWIVEKLWAWSDPHGGGFTRDEICALLTRWWLTGTIGSSMRMYAANAAIPVEQHARRVEVPSGFAVFPGDTLHPPRAWLERHATVVRVTEMPRGGHFAPVEEPELYAGELIDFFQPYRSLLA